jgi:arylsulfatase A-like enzyme
MLSAAGYRTIALGKWHLGYAGHFHPLSRGFDHFHGFLQGSRSYRAIEGTQLNRLLRDREPIPETFDYMTDELARAAAAYIGECGDEPFFMYLAFNAVHTPMHAKDSDVALYPNISPKRRRTLAAMTRSLDEAVGTVLDALIEHDVHDNTIVFFINDNGGAANNASRNEPLRGHKGQMFEGGIRVPFVVQWPAGLPAGLVCAEPAIALDIAPTALAAAGADEPPARPLDGVNLLPRLTGQAGRAAERTLFWRQGEKWAIRRAEWKLLMQDGELMLFNLAEDPHEQFNRAADLPDRVAELRESFQRWNEQLADPRW